jgi:hypothetical protein
LRKLKIEDWKLKKRSARGGDEAPNDSAGFSADTAELNEPLSGTVLAT